MGPYIMVIWPFGLFISQGGYYGSGTARSGADYTFRNEIFRMGNGMN